MDFENFKKMINKTNLSNEEVGELAALLLNKIGVQYGELRYKFWETLTDSNKDELCDLVEEFR